MTRTRIILATVVGLLIAGGVSAASLKDSLTKGTPELKSAGALAFGPEGILFVGDAKGSTVFALDTGDRPEKPATGDLKLDKIDEKAAGALGVKAGDILINDMAVNPASGNVYLAISRGKGSDAKPVILRVTRAGKIEDVALKDIPFSRVGLANPSSKKPEEAITGMAFIKGQVYVAGLSSEEFASKLRVLPFPFPKETDKGTSVEIYHGSHGKPETNAPIRTFTTLDIKGEPNLIAAYTCTPLVKIPLKDLKPGEKITGVTIAELGNRNKPLDMIVYDKDGKKFILMANNNRGVMKISTENIDKIEAITKKVTDKAGVSYETVKDLQGVLHLAKLDDKHAVILAKSADSMKLESVPLP